MSTIPEDHLACALESFEPAKQAYLNGEPGAADAVAEAARAVLQASSTGLTSPSTGPPRSLKEKPSDFLQRVFWAQSALSPILVVAVRIDLFQQLRDADEEGVSSEVLCQNSGIKSQHQLNRILRHLASTEVIGIKKAGVWLSTPLSNELAMDSFQHSILFCHYITRRVFDGFPEYFDRLTKDDDPVEVSGPFQLGMRTPLPFFDYLGANHPYGMYFNYFMQAYRAGNAMWYESYPVAERLCQGFASATSDVFLLDLGGGKGHDLAAFAMHHADHPGKLVLQDQPAVISEAINDDQLFESQAHDFFTPQPIRHARAYYLHSILHDWGDADCQRILANLRPALKPGYSKVLINEIVLSEERPSVAATNMDIMMLGHLNPAYERTESAWRRLIESAGYTVVQIFKVEGAAESVIEAEVA